MAEMDFDKTGAGAATLSPWAIGAGLALDLGESLFGKKQKSSFEYTDRGAREMMQYLQPYIHRLMMGGESPDINLLKKYFGQAFSNLGQAQTSALGTAAGGAGAYAASRGLNPYAYLQHAQSGVYDRYTPQFADLAAQQSLQQFNANRSMLNQMLGLMPSFVSLGGNFGDATWDRANQSTQTNSSPNDMVSNYNKMHRYRNYNPF